MSYWVQETGINKNMSMYRKYECDYISDIQKLPRYLIKGEIQENDNGFSTPCAYGSEAHVIEDNSKWELSRDSNTWVQIESDFSSSLKELASAAGKVSTSEDHTLVGTDIGALEEGSVIPKGTTIDDFINMISQKAISPEYVAPLLELSVEKGYKASTYETGTQINGTLKSVFTKNDAGEIISGKYYKNNEVVNVMESSFDNNTYEFESFNLEDGNTTFKVEIAYAEGDIKNDNLGQPDPTGRIPAGALSKTIAYIGQRNLFYGVGVGDIPELNSENIRSLSGKKLNPTQGYSWNISVPEGQQYVIFAYPSTLRDVTQVMYVETNDTGMAPNFSKELVQVAGANGAVEKEYKVYTYRMAAPAAANMTFKVTI